MTSRSTLAALAALVAGSVAAQPARVVDINPGGSDGVQARSTFFVYGPDNVDRFPRHWNRFVTLNGEAYFLATDGASGTELWRTDGSAEGTVLTADLTLDSDGSFPSTPALYRGALYFTATTSGTNADRELFRYNGFEVTRITDRDLRPVGVGAGGLFLADGDNNGYVLGSCEPDGTGGVACALEEFRDERERQLPAPVVVQGSSAGYFVAGSVMYRTLLTAPTTQDLFPQRRTGAGGGTTDVIGGVGRPYVAGGKLLFDCYYARERTSDIQGVELCESSGGFNDVALVQDFHPGPLSPDFQFVGVYGGQLYAIGRDPVERGTFRLYKTSGGPWSRTSGSDREFYRSDSPNDVFMLEAGTATGYFARRAVTDGPFPATETALFRSDGSRVTASGAGWSSVRTAGAKGRGFFVASRGSETALYQWDGGSTVTELGPLPALPISLKTYGGGVLMDVAGELWSYRVGRPSARQTLAGAGAVTFALALGDDALPLTLDVSALAAGGEVQAAALRADQDSLAAPPPPEATALLAPFYRLSASDGLAGLAATVTVSYTDAAVADAGLGSEADLAVWKTDGAGGWTLLPVVARDPAANTLTAGPIDGFSDFVIGTAAPVAAEDDAATPAARVSLVSPNPASGAAAVTLTLAAPADAQVAVYDALGRRVATLHQGRLGAGRHRLAVDAGALAPGVYLVRAVVAGVAETRRLVVAR